MSIEYVRASARGHRHRRSRSIGWETCVLTNGKRALTLYSNGETVLTEEDVLKLMHVLTTFMVNPKEAMT